MSNRIHNNMTVSYEALFMPLFDSARALLSTRNRLPDHETYNFLAALQTIEGAAREKVRIYNLNLDALQQSIPEHPSDGPGSERATSLDLMRQSGHRDLRDLEVDLADDVEETEQKVQVLLGKYCAIATELLLSKFLDPPEPRVRPEQPQNEVKEEMRCQPA